MSNENVDLDKLDFFDFKLATYPKKFKIDKFEK